MKLKSKKILVTGAGGFVGSHLVERLLNDGCEVSCFVKYNSRNDYGLLEDLPVEKRRQIEIIAGDLRDYNAVNEAVRGIDIVFHLGSLIAIPYSYLHPREVFETNIMGTLNVMLAAREHDVPKIVHTSTSEVYGTATYVPIDEKHPLQGQSPYSASKIGADKIVESFYDSYSLPVATIRPFNIYGPRQSARSVIPTVITQVLSTDEVQLGAVDPTRDFTYVSDVVEAFVDIAALDETAGKVYNIGSNFEISIGELVEKIGSILGKKVEITQDDRRLRPERSEVQRLWADNSLAQKTLGWTPRVTLEEGIKRTIEWISVNLDRYKIGIYEV